MRLHYSTAVLALVLAGCAPALSQTALGRPVAQSAATANPALWPAAKSPEAMTSPQTEAAIDDWLRRMTLEQKVGQLIQADISAISPADLATYPLGSILAGGNSGPFGNERADAATWARLVSAFRESSRASGAGIPILFGVDAVHGHSNLPGATIFPHNIGLGAANDSDLVGRIGAATAAEIAGSGIEWTFAPTLAVPQDLRWGRSYEGYGADPALVARYSRAMTLGLQGTLETDTPITANRVAATAKHFLADGGTQDGRDQGDARISEAALIASHAQGYPAAIDAGALTVMASFSSWNGVKHHGNASLLTDVLKGRMGFQGLVVGDWNGHGQVAGCSNTDCPAAINAGLDLFMAPDSWKALYHSTVAAARDGRISIARLDDAVRRILRVKVKLGLMGKSAIARGDPAQIGAPGHLALAREAVAKSLVLLKNNNAVLPLKASSTILIAGPGADNMAMQAGGWTISWQGSDTRAADFPNGQTIGGAIAEAITAQGGKAVVSPDGAFETKPDTAVIVLGEKPYAEFEGDIADLAFRPSVAEEQLIARLKAQGIRVVILFLSGRPMFTGKLLNQADAFVAAWLPGTQGAGIADVLVAGADGKPARDFTGRLPFAWPADARSPVEKPLFAAGYGLNYGSTVQVPAVNEDPRIAYSAGTHKSSFMVRGKVPAPWRLVQDGSVTARAVDLSAQEDAIQFRWIESGAIAIEGAAVDLGQSLDKNLALTIEWRLDQRPDGPATLGFAGIEFDLSKAAGSATQSTVLKTHIPLRCFKDKGANLAAVGSAIRIQSAKGLVATIRSVHIGPGGENSACPKA